MNDDPGSAPPAVNDSPAAPPPAPEGGSAHAAPGRAPAAAPPPVPSGLLDTISLAASPLALPPPLPVPIGAAPPPRPAPSIAPAVEHVPASIAFLVIVTVTSLAADLVTKGFAKAYLSGFEARLHGPKRYEVWKHHLDFIFAQNPGGAWSFLRSLPDGVRRPFFLVVSSAAIVFIISIYQRVHRDQWAMRWGLPLALGGAMGNLVDRIRYGWVIDFIDFSVRWGGRSHHWPTFNVADIAIVVGVALMAIDMGKNRHFHLNEHPHGAGNVGVTSAP